MSSLEINTISLYTLNFPQFAACLFTCQLYSHTDKAYMTQTPVKCITNNTVNSYSF